MPEGHPRCPDCQGAGGRMLTKVRGRPRWVRCKCVPTGIPDQRTKDQALGRLKEVLEHDDKDPTRLTLALDILHFFQVKEGEILEYLAPNKYTSVSDPTRELIHTYYSEKETDSGQDRPH